MNTTHDTPTPRIRVRLTPTELRRLQRRRDRYAVRLACKAMRLGRGTEGGE
jgi:hypothetical protein